MAYVQCVHKGGETPMHGQTSSGRNNNATSDTRIGHEKVTPVKNGRFDLDPPMLLSNGAIFNGHE